MAVLVERREAFPFGTRLSAVRRSLAIMSEFEFDPTAPWDDCGDNDPDSHSPRLRAYHQRLWSGRPLKGRPDGGTLALEPRGNGLIDTGLGETFFGSDEALFLSSDRVMPTWWNWSDTIALREDRELTARILASNPVLDNMGGIIMWPGWKLNNKPTLNQERGFSQKARIADRFDLTLECIRRAYAGTFASDVNPLGPALERYWEFFALFGDFDGYVEFWMLQDLLTEDGQRVAFFMEGDLPDGWDFATRSPLPATIEQYDEYLRNAQAFVLKRNDRMTHAVQAQVG